MSESSSAGPLDHDIPEDLYVALVAALFTNAGALLLGCVATTLACVTTAAVTHSVTIWSFAILLPLLGALRVLTLRQFERVKIGLDVAKARIWERRYTIGATLYMLFLGLWTLAVYWLTDDAFPRILSLVATIAHALGIATRNFSFKLGTDTQLVAGFVPLTAAFLVAGGLYMTVIPLVLLPLLLFIKGSASRLRETFLTAMLSQRESKVLADRFDTALKNMPHGLCMFTRSGICTVVNERLLRILDVDASSVAVGMSGTDILATLIAQQKIDVESARRVEEAFADPQDGRTINFETSSGTCLELAIRTVAGIGSVVVLQDITERRNTERVIDRMAHVDAATGLPNRRVFEERLARAVSDYRTERDRIAVLFIDIDNFKQVNDSMGHHAGDQLLSVIGQRLQSVMRGTDTVARWGGDEFVVILSPSIDRTHVAGIADRLIREVARPCDVRGHNVIVGASIGIACLPEDGTDAEELLSKADMSLYVAKSDGRNRWRSFERSMDDRVKTRLRLETELRTAIASQSFDIHYQPVVETTTRTIVGFEALARWVHPTRGNVSPAEFIPIIEELGLMDQFGAAVLRKACEFCVDLPVPVRVSVNLSPTQFWSGQLVAIVSDTLAATGLPPNRLELEITETTLLDARTTTRDALATIREIGATIALDDFGTGYSSLSYLLNFPLDRVKLDRSFVLGIGVERKASILVESIAQMCSKLGMQVVLEGVETEQQMAFVARSGNICEVQGYLFSRPLPAIEIPRLLERHVLSAA